MVVGASPFSYRFGAFDLQPLERRLLSSGTPVPVGPLALDVLLALVRRDGRLVTKSELLSTVWPKVVVEENALQAQVSALRKVLGHKAIETVAGRGYRFAEAVTPVAAKTKDPPKHNLPPERNNFVGRDSEREELRLLLERSRLVTLAGAGGCGKTRLALHLANRLLGSRRDGIWFVELAPLSDARLVPSALARALNMPNQGGPATTDSLLDYLAKRDVLLILDNAEHLLEACAQLSDRIVGCCPHVHVLVTSRAPLGTAHEIAYRVPSLPPSASVQLFVDRARVHSPGFDGEGAAVPVLTYICQKLDGIPLAIELAAARHRTMALNEIERRLDQRFALLMSTTASALPRQRTLRSLLDWSYDLLAPAEQAVLRRLSCFRGGCTPDAAEHVCSGDGVDAAAVVGYLHSLVDKSLLISHSQPAAPRFTLLETVRHYALDRSIEAGDVQYWRARHFDYFLDAVQRDIAALKEGQLTEGYARLDADLGNHRAALDWSMDVGGSVSRGMRLALLLTDLWYGSHVEEARTTFQRLLAHRPEEQDPSMRAQVLNQVAHGHTWIGQHDVAQARYEEALELGRRVDDRSVNAFALWGLSEIARTQGELHKARALLEDSIALYRDLGEDGLANDATRGYARVLQLMGDVVAARESLRQSIDFDRAKGRMYSAGSSLYVLAGLCRDIGELDEARHLAEEALVIQREFNRLNSTAYALRLLAALDCDQGDFASARIRLRDCLPIIVGQGGERVALALVFETMGHAWRSERPLRAARLWGALERLREELGAPVKSIDASRLRDGIAHARVSLNDDTAFDVAWQEGRTWGLQEAIAFALASEAP